MALWTLSWEWMLNQLKTNFCRDLKTNRWKQQGRSACITVHRQMSDGTPTTQRWTHHELDDYTHSQQPREAETRSKEAQNPGPVTTIIRLCLARVAVTVVKNTQYSCAKIYA